MMNAAAREKNPYEIPSTGGIVKVSLNLMLAAAFCGVSMIAFATSPRSSSEPEAEPVQVKVVVVTMFEVGADEGDRAGEFQLWKARRNLSKVYPFLGYRDLHFDPDTGLLVLVTGIGTARSTAAVMALGMDPRFDLTKAYWVVTGIAGFDPEDASIGSAA